MALLVVRAEQQAARHARAGVARTTTTVGGSVGSSIGTDTGRSLRPVAYPVSLPSTRISTTGW
ncbi:hypothetical protein AB6O49_15665 [Streptomyces sp. SBR177]